jgi:hypothetical protein
MTEDGEWNEENVAFFISTISLRLLNSTNTSRIQHHMNFGRETRGGGGIRKRVRRTEILSNENMKKVNLINMRIKPKEKG